MAAEVAALRAKLAKTERDEDQWKAQEQKVAEFTKRNLLLETENQLLRQKLQESELQAQLRGEVTQNAAMYQA